MYPTLFTIGKMSIPTYTVLLDLGLILGLVITYFEGKRKLGSAEMALDLGLWTVIGGIVGGVLGHQVGGGRGKDVATVAGALGGALLGNEVEKNRSSVAAWDVRVRLDDGTSRVVRLDREPSWRAGEKVRIENGRIVGR